MQNGQPVAHESRTPTPYGRNVLKVRKSCRPLRLDVSILRCIQVMYGSDVVQVETNYQSLKDITCIWKPLHMATSWL